MLCLSCVGGGQSPSVVLWPSCCLFTLGRVTSLASSMYSRTVSTQYPRTGHVTRKPAKPAAETTEQITPAFTARRSVALVWTDAGGVIDAEQHRLRHNTGLQEPPILLSIVRTQTLILYHNGSTPLGQKSIIFPSF